MIERKQAIINYLKKSEKKPEDFLIGAELEYFVVDKNTLESISYYGKQGIESLLQELIKYGFEPQLENGRILGNKNNDLAITLEPGAQFEISLEPQKEISVLQEKYQNFMQILKPILAERDQELHSAGYHPVTKIEEIKVIPKKRYDFMAEYLKGQGSLALYMMKGTASVQVAIDFSSETDFVNKMQLASKLTPILSAVFDNSPIFENWQYHDFCLRTKIWNNCDADRCGIIPQTFLPDFGYEQYADYLLNLVPIFIEKNGKYEQSLQPFKDIFDPSNELDLQLNHIFSICFPDVRARNYIELRMTDSLPYPLNFAYLYLIFEIFYHPPMLKKVCNLLKNITLPQINKTKIETIKSGVYANYGDDNIINLFRKILAFMPKQENNLFKPLSLIAESGSIPRENKIYS